jgi:hypothetical protein
VTVRKEAESWGAERVPCSKEMSWGVRTVYATVLKVYRPVLEVHSTSSCSQQLALRAEG